VEPRNTWIKALMEKNTNIQHSYQNNQRKNQTADIYTWVGTYTNFKYRSINFNQKRQPQWIQEGETTSIQHLY